MNDRRFIAFAVLALLFSVGCKHSPKEGVVHMENGQFVLNEEPFFPMALNYILAVYVSGDSLYAGPSKDYARIDPNQLPTKANMLKALRADMEYIHEAGFNTVRLVGIGELVRNKNGAWISAHTMHGVDSILELSPGDTRFLDALEEALKIVREAGSRTILLTTVHADVPETEEHFKMIAERISEDTALMAFDMFNEPLYFDKPERPKTEAIKIAKHWHDLVREYAPDQLYTVGLTGIRETFEFDPNLLYADFISFHPYEYEPDQVRNELFWYHNNVDVPWIIGETAIPADNDSVPYEYQRLFAERVLRQSRACGAAGFSWWQYKDVLWEEFHPSYMGVLNRVGVSRTSKGYEVKGSPKPVMRALTDFDPWADPGPCICLPNYLNYSEGTASKITGTLVDENGAPIVEGTILAWNEFWSSSYHTTSGPDGRFELKGPFYFFHWMASATRHKMERGDVEPMAFRRGADSIPSFELDRIVLEQLKLP